MLNVYVTWKIKKLFGVTYRLSLLYCCVAQWVWKVSDWSLTGHNVKPSESQLINLYIYGVSILTKLAKSFKKLTSTFEQKNLACHMCYLSRALTSYGEVGFYLYMYHICLVAQVHPGCMIAFPGYFDFLSTTLCRIFHS